MKSDRLTFLAINIDRSKMPNMNPLYWKCIWSTMRKPGWRNSEADRIRCVGGSIAPRTNLRTPVKGISEGVYLRPFKDC